MNARDAGWTVLLADGVGCLVGAGLISAHDPTAASLGLVGNGRRATVGALAASGLYFGRAAVRATPRPADLLGAAAVNLGWVVASLAALRRAPTRIGVVLWAGTAALDAAAGIIQWRLAGTRDRSGG